MQSKMDYFFRVSGGSKDYYTCFTSHSKYQARRNCLFACFEDDVEDWRDLNRTERYALLETTFGHLVQDTSEENYLLYKDDEE
jgi:hypothetical protein